MTSPTPRAALRTRRRLVAGDLLFFLCIFVAGGGLVLAALEQWRLGAAICALALLLAAPVRAFLSDEQAGMLRVRRKLVDVVVLICLGAGLLVLALVAPPRS